MPNYVKNNLKFDCPKKRVDQILQAIKNDSEGIGTIDFEKLIPMPKSLKIESGSVTNKAVSLYLTFINPDVKHFGRVENKVSESEIYDLYHNAKSKVSCNPHLTTEEIKETTKYQDENELITLGKQIIDNIMKYGFTDWYEWSIGNWGTKWNAVDSSFDGEKLSFQTAWSAPHPIVEKLAQMFPDVQIEHVWADEDIGTNCGRHTYYDGERIEEYYPEIAKDRFEFATSAWGYSPQDCSFVLNASETAYIYVSEDDYDIVSFQNHHALFSNDRLTKNNIPKGLYCYDIRGTDNDSGQFGTLERTVRVNCAGTLVTDTPIDFGDKDYISLSGENEIDFLGTKATLVEFLNHEYDLEEGMIID